MKTLPGTDDRTMGRKSFGQWGDTVLGMKVSLFQPQLRHTDGPNENVIEILRYMGSQGGLHGNLQEFVGDAV